MSAEAWAPPEPPHARGFVAAEVRRAARNAATVGLLLVALGLACLLEPANTRWLPERDLVASHVLGAAFLVLGLGNVALSLVRGRWPQWHPSVRALKRHGTLGEVVAQLDAEASEALGADAIAGPQPRRIFPTAGRFVVTEHWLVHSAPFGFDTWALDEVLWMQDWARGPGYTCVSVHSHRPLRHTKASASSVDEALDEIKIRAPWIVVGDEPSTRALVGRDAAALAAFVAARRATVAGRLAARKDDVDASDVTP